MDEPIPVEDGASFLFDGVRASGGLCLPTFTAQRGGIAYLQPPEGGWPNPKVTWGARTRHRWRAARARWGRRIAGRAETQRWDWDEWGENR